MSTSVWAATGPSTIGLRKAMTSFSTQPTPTGTASPDLSVGQDSPACRCASAREALDRLIDERRALAAQVAGKDLEIAMLLGERDTAKRALVEMLAQIEARRAVRECADEQGPTCAPASSVS